MLFQVREDRTPTTARSDFVSFHNPRDISLLLIAFGLYAFGTFCLFEGEPKKTAECVAIVCLFFASVALFFGGLSAEVIFRRDAQTMEVKWEVFSFALISHSHPYDAISLSVQSFAKFSSGTRGVSQIASATMTQYVANLGSSCYLLFLPSLCPAEERRLGELRGILGLNERA
jgi:hypothetical protein